MSQEIHQPDFRYKNNTCINYEEPEALYKYYSLNGANLDRVLLSILSRKFWFSRRKDFNDPYDSMVWFENPEKPIHRMNDDEKETLQTQQSLVDRINNTGIFSLTSNPFNLLMWSHYADAHRGICIEFERDPNTIFGPSTCKRVEYIEDLTILYNESSFQNFDDFVQCVIVRKSNAWEYEHEWRVIRELPLPRNLNSNMVNLNTRMKSIIFGMLADLNLISYIIERTLDLGVNYFQMVPCNECAQLVCKPIPIAINRVDGIGTSHNIVYDGNAVEAFDEFVQVKKNRNLPPCDA